MHSELSYFARSLISGLNISASTLKVLSWLMIKVSQKKSKEVYQEYITCKHICIHNMNVNLLINYSSQYFTHTSQRCLKSGCSMRMSSHVSLVTTVAWCGVSSSTDSPNMAPGPSLQMVTASWKRESWDIIRRVQERSQWEHLICIMCSDFMH